MSAATPYDAKLEDEHLEKGVAPQLHGDIAQLYAEALERYGADGEIDPEAEKRLKRKLDVRILPILGVCYFFYVSPCELRARHTVFRDIYPTPMLTNST